MSSTKANRRDVLLRSSRVRVYQDESGMNDEDPYLLLGLLLMEESVERRLEKELRRIAATENVVGEVHFRELRKDVSGCSGAKFRVLQQWLGETYECLSAGTVWLTVLAVDKRKIDRTKLPEDYMCYNRFSRTAIESTLSRYAWDVGKGFMRVIVHCDAHCLKGSADQSPADNYGQYLRKQLRESFNSKSTEKQRGVSIRGVRVHLDDSQESRILQLVDGILGSVRQHIMQDASRQSKVLLAKLVGLWLSDTPAARAIAFGHLSAQIFPNDEGSFSPLT